MKRQLATLMAAALAAGIASPALAVDGHGNAANPSFSVPNTGGVSGGPNHRDDPRAMEAQRGTVKERTDHSTKDGHGHEKAKR